MGLGVLDWKQLDQKQFDRVVEVLIYRMYRDQPDARVEVPDGRGGDGGIDIAVYSGERLEHVYQLKYFPEGMSGGQSRRREQVRQSYKKAASLVPPKWTLVTPGNLTAQERRFVRGLSKDHTKIAPAAMGRVELDHELVKWPDVQHAFTRDPFLETLRGIQMQGAALASPSDLREQAVAFGAKVDGRSPYWGTSVTVNGPNVTSMLHAKHPESDKLEPLSIEMVTNHTALDPDTRSRFEDFLGYGVGKKVVLPAEAIASVKLIGPEWWAETLPPDTQVELFSVPGARVPVEIELREIGDDDQIVTSWRGKVTNGGSGRAGGAIEVVVPGGVTLLLRFPTDPAQASRITVSRGPFDSTPRQAARAIRLGQRIAAQAKFDLVAYGKRLARFAMNEGNPPTEDDAYWLQVADDLTVIERELDLDGRMPSDLTWEQRVGLRTLRLLLDGRCVLMHELTEAKLPLNGKSDAAFEKLLTEGGGLAAEGSFNFEIDGTPVELPGVKTFHPSLQITNAAEAIERLRAGTAEGFTLLAKPTDGTPFRAFLPARWADETAPLIPSPLEIPGADEHPALAQLHHAATGAGAIEPVE